MRAKILILLTKRIIVKKNRIIFLKEKYTSDIWRTIIDQSFLIATRAIIRKSIFHRSIVIKYRPSNRFSHAFVHPCDKSNPLLPLSQGRKRAGKTRSAKGHVPGSGNGASACILMSFCCTLRHTRGVTPWRSRFSAS